MKSYEMVEKLSEKTNVSLAQAKEALEKNSWDMLDSAIFLEQQKKSASTANAVNQNPFNVAGQGYAQFSGAASNNTTTGNTQYSRPSTSFSEMLGRLFGKTTNAVNRGMKNSFVVRKNGNKVLQLPLLVFLIALIVAFMPVVPLLFLGLFFDFTYSFESSFSAAKTMDDFLSKSKTTAEKIQQEFKAEYEIMKEDFEKGKNSTAM